MTDPDKELAIEIIARGSTIEEYELGRVNIDRVIINIAKALRKVREEENEACANVLQNLGEMALNSEGNFRSAQWKICDEALTAIRNRMEKS